MASEEVGERAGYPKYLKQETIEIIDNILIPVLTKLEEREVKFSDVIHKAVVFFKNKHGYHDPKIAPST